MENQEKKYEIRKFIDGDLELDVRFSYDGKTVWLSTNEIALLFERDVKTIRKHINSIIENKAIDESTVAKFATVQIEGNRKVTRKIEYYNLDIILSVGYRTKSNRINRFNNWVIEKLKELNNKLLLQKSLSYANNYEIVKFESGDISLDVNVSPNEDTVWLTQREIATLFDKSISTINEHINNILVDELVEREVSKFGKTEFGNRPITYYNLDMVLSIGYRVNSKRGIEFRKWANKVLRDYLIKGYAINNKRCLEHSDILNNISNEIIKIKTENTKQIENLNKKIDSLDKKVKENTKELEIINASDALINGTLVYEGNVYKAYSFIRDLFLKANKRLIIVDGYVDKSVLDMLEDINNEISIYTYPSANITKIDIDKFKNNHKLNVIKQKELHARFIIVDDDIYQISESIKDVGKKRFVSSKIDFITVDELLKKSK